jgi:hypothetical protein
MIDQPVLLASATQVLFLLGFALGAELAFYFDVWSLAVIFPLFAHVGFLICIGVKWSWHPVVSVMVSDVAACIVLSHVYGRRKVAAWQDCADRLGLRFSYDEAECDTFTLSGSASGFYIEVQESRGWEAPGSNTVSIDTRGKIPSGVVITSLRGTAAWPHLPRRPNRPTVPVGDRAFEREFGVWGSESQLLAVLGASARSALTRELTFSCCNEGLVSFETSGFPPGRLLQTIRRLVNLAELLCVAPNEVPTRLQQNAQSEPMRGVRERNIEVRTRYFPEGNANAQGPLASAERAGWVAPGHWSKEDAEPPGIVRWLTEAAFRRNSKTAWERVADDLRLIVVFEEARSMSPSYRRIRLYGQMGQFDVSVIVGHVVTPSGRLLRTSVVFRGTHFIRIETGAGALPSRAVITTGDEALDRRFRVQGEEALVLACMSFATRTAVQHSLASASRFLVNTRELTWEVDGNPGPGRVQQCLGRLLNLADALSIAPKEVHDRLVQNASADSSRRGLVLNDRGGMNPAPLRQSVDSSLSSRAVSCSTCVLRARASRISSPSWANNCPGTSASRSRRARPASVTFMSTRRSSVASRRRVIQPSASSRLSKGVSVPLSRCRQSPSSPIESGSVGDSQSRSRVTYCG